MTSILTSFIRLAQVDTSSAAFRIGELVGTILAVVLLISVPVFFVLSIIRFNRTKHGGWLAVVILTGLPLIAFVVIIGLGFYKGFQEGFENARASHEGGEAQVVLTGDDRYAFTMPGHWTKLELNPVAILEVGSERHEEYLLVIKDPKSSFQGSLGEFADAVNRMYLESLQAPEELTMRPTMVNGLVCIRSEFRGEFNGLPVHFIVLVVDGDDSYYQVAGWTVQSGVDGSLPVLNEVLASMKRQNPQASPVTATE